MPVLTRLFIRTSLVYFVLALGAGILLALPVPVPGLRPVYLHLLMVGWVTQLIIGVAHWMFPKYSADQPRGSRALAWATYLFINAGLILRALGEPLAASGVPVGGLLAASAVLQSLGGWAFVINVWPRIRER